jgi:hypothetical protein
VVVGTASGIPKVFTFVIGSDPEANLLQC